MSWEWSHTPEAYCNARDNVHKLSRKKLREAYAEIKASQKDEYGCYGGGMCDKEVEQYKTIHKQSKDIPKDILADSVWDFMEEFRTCDRGGHNAYCCPYGCHMVSFSKEEE